MHLPPLTLLPYLLPLLSLTNTALATAQQDPSTPPAPIMTGATCPDITTNLTDNPLFNDTRLLWNWTITDFTTFNTDRTHRGRSSLSFGFVDQMNNVHTECSRSIPPGSEASLVDANTFFNCAPSTPASSEEIVVYFQYLNGSTIVLKEVFACGDEWTVSTGNQTLELECEEFRRGCLCEAPDVVMVNVTSIFEV